MIAQVLVPYGDPLVSILNEIRNNAIKIGYIEKVPQVKVVALLNGRLPTIHIFHGKQCTVVSLSSGSR